MDLKEAQLWTDGSRHPWERARYRVVDALLKSDCEHPVTRRSSIIDIGCGDAYILRQLRSRYPRTQMIGVDAALPGSKQVGTDVTSGTVIPLFRSMAEAAATLTGPVSHVLLLDVLEHIPDEKVFLGELLSILPVDASTGFMVTVPAFPLLFSSHDQFLNHKRRYTQRSLRKTLQYAGLEITGEGYFFMSLLLPRCWQVIREKLMLHRLRNGSDLLRTSPQNRFVGWCITEWLLLDYLIGAVLRKQGIHIGGLSAFALCRKHV